VSEEAKPFWREALAQLGARALASRWALEPPHPEEFSRIVLEHLEELTRENIALRVEVEALKETLRAGKGDE